MSAIGIDIRKSGNILIFRASLKDTSGAKVTTGTTTLALLELQDDGTFKTFDWSSHTFKAIGMTSSASTTAMTHRSRITDADATVTTGLWTTTLDASLAASAMTVGRVYIAQVTNSSASPPDQEREFQYGAVEGDLVLGSDGKAVLSADNTVDSITLASALEAILAVLAGKAVVTGSDVVYKKRDGTTTKVSVTFDTSGNRSASTIS